MPKLSRHHVTIAAATAAAAVGGTAVAGAAGNGTTTGTAATQQRPSGGPGAGETALTGTTKDKVQEAALAKVPGTVLRVETDNGGVYEAHIRKADGTEVEVKVDKEFNVTATETFDGKGRGPGGRGGHGGPRADLTAVANKLGVSQAELQSAVDAARPAGKDHDHGPFAAAVAKALGKSTADVEAAFEAARPTR